MVFGAEKQQPEKAREKEVRRAVLLIKRLNEKPPTDLTQKVALCELVQKIPDDIRVEAEKAPQASTQPPPNEAPIRVTIAVSSPSLNSVTSLLDDEYFRM